MNSSDSFTNFSVTTNLRIVRKTEVLFVPTVDVNNNIHFVSKTSTLVVTKLVILSDELVRYLNLVDSKFEFS